MGLTLNRERAEVEAEVRTAVHDFASSVASSNRVVADMSALVSVTSALPLSNLAYWEQLIRSEFSIAQRLLSQPKASSWLARFPFAAPREKNLGESGRFLTWIDLVSFDGYVREKTLRALSGPAPNSFFLAMAVRRLNDWVPQVRSAARAIIPTLVRASDPEHVVDVLCAMLPTWTVWGRAELPDSQTLMELLYVDSVADALRRRLISESAGPLSLILSQVLRTSVLDDHLVEIAKEAVQPAVRARAQTALLTTPHLNRHTRSL